MQTIVKPLGPAMSLILVLMLAATGCSGGEGGAAATAVEVVERVMPQVNLPRITVSFDEAGAPKVFGVKVSTLGRLIGQDLSGVSVPAETLNKLTDAGVQHVELDLNNTGVYIFANGQPMPYIAWDEERLAEIGNVLAATDVVPNGEIIKKAMPLVGRIGLDVVAKFSTTDAEVPVRDRKERFLVERVELPEPTALIQATMNYDAAGKPSIAGITSDELGQLMGSDMSGIEMTDANMAMIKAAGINDLAVVTETDGLHLVMNGKELLHVAYNQTSLTNALDFYIKFSGAESEEEIRVLINELVPILEGADIDLVARFAN